MVICVKANLLIQLRNQITRKTFRINDKNVQKLHVNERIEGVYISMFVSRDANVQDIMKSIKRKSFILKY